MRARIKKNDTVMVITGRERGKTGKVLRVLPEKDRALIERLNMVKRHQKPRGPQSASGHRREGSVDPPLERHDHVRQVQRAGAHGQATRSRTGTACACAGAAATSSIGDRMARLTENVPQGRRPAAHEGAWGTAT